MSNKFDFKTLETGFEADWPVVVSAPLDGGTFQDQTFTARFKTPTRSELAEIAAIADWQPRLKRALQIGLVGLGKDEGETLTPALFEDLWAMQNVQLALIRAYGAFQSGAPAKN